MSGTKPTARRVFYILRRCAVLAVIGLGAVACGLQSQHQAGSGSPGAGNGASPQPAGGPCTTEELKVSLDVKSAGVAAGTSLIPLDFTNVGTASCELAGFADVSFVTSSSGHQVGPAATVDRNLSPQSLRLAAGSSAHLWLRLVEAADLPMSACKPKNVAGLMVRLPGQATSIFIAHQFTTCAKRVHGTDVLTVEPFKAGLARAGTAQ